MWVELIDKTCRWSWLVNLWVELVSKRAWSGVVCVFAADPWFPPVVQWIMSLRKKVSSSKKGPQPSLGPSTSSDKTSPVASETSKARLLELFSLIEKEFESLHSENAARETQIHSHTH